MSQAHSEAQEPKVANPTKLALPRSQTLIEHSPSRESQGVQRQQSWIQRGRATWGGNVVYATLFAPLEAAELSMKEMLQAEQGERDQLTHTWRKQKQSELKYVGLTAALICALFSGAFSWYNAEEAEWYVLFLWYAGLLCAIASIATATQQAVTLYRFTTLRECAKIIRGILKSAGDETRPRRVQVYVWQVPVMLLRYSIFFFTLGLVVLLWTTRGEGERGHNDTKVAIIVTALTGIIYLHHWFCTFTVYSRWDAEKVENLQRGGTFPVTPNS